MMLGWAITGLYSIPLAQADGSFWFPAPSSTGADTVDSLFRFILGVSVIFFALIVAVMATFLLKYRRRAAQPMAKTATHSNVLEAVWTIIPTILVAIIFLWGFFGYLDMRTAPDNSYEIQVVAKKWNWSFIYPNGHIDNNLHVPIDQPIQLVMSSDDVIHSLYVPAFRVKMDVVPGRYSKTWFEATEQGEYNLFCAEYCGTQHSTMLAKVVVHRSGEFEKWLDEAANFLKKMMKLVFSEPFGSEGELLDSRQISDSLREAFLKGGQPLLEDARVSVLQAAQRWEIVDANESYILEKDADTLNAYLMPAAGGEILYTRRGCAQCHSVDGSAKVGPSFKGVFGTQQQMTSGETITVDENYLRESILEPQAKIRAGYKPVMPTYQGQLKNEEISAIIQYIKSLK